MLADIQQLALSLLWTPHVTVRRVMSILGMALFWRRFVDDTFTILQSSQKISFLEHLNSIDEHIQLTSEEASDDGSISFLDVLIIPDEKGNLKTTVYRKPTHMDLYLQCNSNHTVSSKYSVVSSLQHRASTICSNKELLVRRTTPGRSTHKMQIPYMGNKQSQNEDQNCCQQQQKKEQYY